MPHSGSSNTAKRVGLGVDLSPTQSGPLLMLPGLLWQTVYSALTLIRCTSYEKYLKMKFAATATTAAIAVVHPTTWAR